MFGNTVSAKAADVVKQWVVIDAAGLVVGRLASIIALRLRGKHKKNFTPHIDDGDNIIVINAEKIVLTGRKRAQKVYYHHTGYIGSLTEIPFRKLHAQRPDDVLQLAVKRMLPKTTTGRNMLKRLMLYKGTAHPHGAQAPQPL